MAAARRPVAPDPGVQSLEGGIVGAMAVHEGDIVQQGEVLVRIDDTKFASEFGEVRERRGAMAARVARLEAELKGLPKPEFTDELRQSAPAAVQAETSVFETRKRKLSEDVDVLTQQETRLAQTLSLLNREVELTKKLYDQKVVPEIEWLRLTRQAADMKGQLAEVQSRKANALAAFRAQADEDMAKSRGDLAVLDENIKSAQDRVRRADLQVAGLRHRQQDQRHHDRRRGAAGRQPDGIVPLEDALLVEGRIRPQDIAFIRPDQDAVVKISAYDSNVYGHLNGRVERISADTIADEKAANKEEKAETFYRVMVRTDTNHLGTTAHPLPIIPGMVATVEVLTGHKTVLDYLVKPARMLRDEALRER